MEPDDTVTGGESLSVDQAAAAYAKATSEGAGNGQPEDEALPHGDEADELQASDEDEGDETGGPDDEGQPDDEDDAEQETDQGRFVADNAKVRLPDGTVLTVGELRQGNLRDRDYRQKTMETAELRRSVEAQSSSIQAKEQQLNQQMEYVSGLMQSMMPQAPDPAMFDTDIVGYLQAKENAERYSQHINYVNQQLQANRQQAEQAMQQQRQQKDAEEWVKLQEKLPHLKDQAKARTFADGLRSAGEMFGFSPQEVMNYAPYDHRFALLLHEGAKWRKLQASKPKMQEKVQGRPPVTKGGKRMSPDARRATQASEAFNRLKETGTVEDATRAYLASKG
jgi:hypothetical protein